MNGWHALVVILLLASAVRMAGLGTRDFFGDEILTVNAARGGLVTDPDLTGPPHWHPPLHYSPHHLAWRLGASSEFGWRMPGVLFGTLLAAATFLAALYAGAVRTSLLAGIFVALSPFGVLFSQTARWHPIAGGITALACACAAYAVSRRSLWAWGVAGLFLAMASHIVYLAIAVALILFAVLLPLLLLRGKSVRGWLVGAIVFVVGIAPISSSAISAASGGTTGVGIVRSVLSWAGKGLLLLENLTAGPTVLPWNWPIMVIAALAFIPPLYFFLISRGNELDGLRAPLAAFFVACFAFGAIMPIASHPRYWLVLLLPAGIAIGGGITHARPRWFRLLLMAAVGVVFGYGLFNLYSARHYQYKEFTDNWRKLAQEAKTLAGPESEILTLSAPFEYYYGPDAEMITSIAGSRASLDRFVKRIDSRKILLQYSPLSGWEHMDYALIADRIGRVLKDRGYRRKWVRKYGYDPHTDIKRRFLEGRSFPDYRHRLALYVRTGSGPRNDAPPPDQ